MSRKIYKPKGIVVLTSQGQGVAEAIRSIGVSEVTYYRWRQEFGGLKSDQVFALVLSASIMPVPSDPSERSKSNSRREIVATER